MWIWLALYDLTQEIVRVFTGSRDKTSAKGYGVFYLLPKGSALCSTPTAYTTVFPNKRQHAVGKSCGKTDYLECFNFSLRQRTGPKGATLSKTEGVTSCAQHLIVLEKAGKPPQRHLDFHASQQCILTPLGLPKRRRVQHSRVSEIRETLATLYLHGNRLSKAFIEFCRSSREADCRDACVLVIAEGHDVHGELVIMHGEGHQQRGVGDKFSQGTKKARGRRRDFGFRRSLYRLDFNFVGSGASSASTGA
jgi:hypothetical protein